MTSEAKTYFENARAVARAQGAHMFERRVSLGDAGGRRLGQASR
jgi:hypothetical protein